MSTISNHGTALEQTPSTFVCPDCQTICPTNARLMKHFRVHKTHVQVNYSPTQSETVHKQTNGRYYCPKCNQFDTSSPSLMQKHGGLCISTVTASNAIGDLIPGPSEQFNRDQAPKRSYSAISTDSVQYNYSIINPIQDFQSSQHLHPTALTATTKTATPHTTPSAITLTSPSTTPSTTLEATLSTPVSDHQSELIENSESTFVSMPLGEEVYAKYLPFIGLVVHKPSGAVVCLHCKKCFLLASIVNHFMSLHKLNAFVRKYNQALEGVASSKKIIVNEIQSDLITLGAKHYSELGFYVSPAQNPLPVIEVLPIQSGYMCSYCPLPGVTSTAFFGSKMSTMNKHHSEKHKGILYDEKPVECYIQHLYGDQGHFKYFRVEKFYQGPTIKSTITAEGDQRYQAFLQENPEFHKSLDPSTMVKDTRVQSKFYSKVHWFGLASTVLDGEDTAAGRVLLYNWVNNLHKGSSEYIKGLDFALDDWIRKYFYYIQDILTDSSMNVYYERCKVMHDDPSTPFPTEGLNALTKSTCDRYAAHWFKYVKMLILGATDQLGTHPSGAFQKFGDKVLNDSIRDSTVKFASAMTALLDGSNADNQGTMAKQIFPVLHSYFLDIASEETPKSREMYKSSVTIYVAFKQLGYLGNWKSVRNIKAAPIMLKYGIRCIVFLDMLLEKGEICIDGDIDMDHINRMSQDQDHWEEEDLTSSDFDTEED